MSTLREETVVDKIEILENGEIRVRRARRIYDGDTLIHEAYRREAPLLPGDKVDGAPARVQTIAAALWTPEVVTAHRQKRERDEAADAARTGSAPRGAK